MEGYLDDSNAHVSLVWNLYYYWQSRGYARGSFVEDILAPCPLDDLAGRTPLVESLSGRKQAGVLSRLSDRRVCPRHSAASEHWSHQLRLLEGHVSLRKASVPQNYLLPPIVRLEERTGAPI